METLSALVVYGSTTGTTQLLAVSVGRGLRAAGLDVVVRNAVRVRPQDLSRYRVVIAGCSTWEDGKLQRDFQRLVDQFGSMRLDGVAAAVFGPGSRAYNHFCHAVDVVEEEFTGRGANLMGPSFRVDGSAYPVREEAQNWARGLAAQLA
jgi:flavodoxin short chain